MQVVVAAKKFGSEGQWRGALIVDNEFQDSYSEKTVHDVVNKALGPVLAATNEEASEVIVTVTVKGKASSG